MQRGAIKRAIGNIQTLCLALGKGGESRVCGITDEEMGEGRGHKPTSWPGLGGTGPAGHGQSPGVGIPSRVGRMVPTPSLCTVPKGDGIHKLGSSLGRAPYNTWLQAHLPALQGRISTAPARLRLRGRLRPRCNRLTLVHHPFVRSALHVAAKTMRHPPQGMVTYHRWLPLRGIVSVWVPGPPRRAFAPFMLVAPRRGWRVAGGVFRAR